MDQPFLIHEELTRSVIGAYYEVYNNLGYGFLEHMYSRALELELRDRGHSVAREASFRVFYKAHEIGAQRIDMIVDGTLIVEIKSTFRLHPSASRQLLNYLKGTTLEIGLLLHFGPSPSFFRLVASNHYKPDRVQGSIRARPHNPPFPNRGA